VLSEAGVSKDARIEPKFQEPALAAVAKES